MRANLFGACSDVRLSCGLIASALVFVHASAASAYRTAADLPDFADDAVVRWKSDSIALELYQEGAPGFSFAETKSVVDQALQAWSAPDCSAVDFRPTTRSATEATPGDGHNTIEWLSSGWAARGYDPELPAITDVQYEHGMTTGRIVEADIYLNADHRVWRLQADPSQADAGPDDVDVLGVVTHEAGHVIGLLHPCEVDPKVDTSAPSCASDASFRRTAMYPLYSSAEAFLSGDDVRGVCFLYPLAAAASPMASGSAMAVGRDATACSTPAAKTSLATLDDASTLATPLQPEPSPTDPRVTDAGAACVASQACVSDGGTCHRAAQFGARCSKASACESRECLSGILSEPVCTRACNAQDACPSGWNCLTVDKRQVCVPAQHGCSTAGHPLATPSWVGLWLVSLVCLVQRRRHRRRAHSSVHG